MDLYEGSSGTFVLEVGNGVVGRAFNRWRLSGSHEGNESGSVAGRDS